MKSVGNLAYLVEVSLDTDLLERQIERIQTLAESLPENMRANFAKYVADWLERDGASMAFSTQCNVKGIRVMGVIRVEELDKIIQEALAVASGGK